MSVESTTTLLGLSKFVRGHSVLDTDLGANMDLIDAKFVASDAIYETGEKVSSGALTADSSGAFAFTWKNPETVAILVNQVVVDVTTAGGTGSSVMDVGVASSAAGTGDTILDGIDINADAVYSSLSAGVSGTNATENTHRVDEADGTNDYITGKILVADASNMVGNYYIKYMKVL